MTGIHEQMCVLMEEKKVYAAALRAMSRDFLINVMS